MEAQNPTKFSQALILLSKYRGACFEPIERFVELEHFRVISLVTFGWVDKDLIVRFKSAIQECGDNVDTVDWLVLL